MMGHYSDGVKFPLKPGGNRTIQDQFNRKPGQTSSQFGMSSCIDLELLITLALLVLVCSLR